MGAAWAKNLFTPLEVPESELENIPYPRAELHIHILYKTTQVGTILGLFLAPGVAVFTKRASQMVPICGSFMKRGCLVGTVAGPVMTEVALNKKQATPESIYDRCYRLRHNRNQVRVDRGATYGDVLGFAAGMAVRGSPILGALYGYSIGTVGTGLYNNLVLAPKKE